MKTRRTTALGITIAAVLATTGATLPAHADADSDSAAMVHRTSAIFGIEADPTLVVSNHHDGWGVRLIVSDGGTTTPHAAGFTGFLTLSSGPATYSVPVSSASEGFTTPQIDIRRFGAGPIRLHVELTATGDTDTAVYDNPSFTTATWRVTRVGTLWNGGCIVAGNRKKVLWGRVDIDGWGDRPTAITVQQRLYRGGRLVLTRALPAPTTSDLVDYGMSWPKYDSSVNWSWNGKIRGRVRPGVYRSQITVTDRTTGHSYRLKKSPGLKVLPASARTCTNVAFR